MERLAVGRITAIHGLQGFLKIKSLSGESEHFFRLKNLYIRRGEEFLPFAVEAVKGAAGSILIKLAGIENPEAGARYRGCEVWVERSEACVLGEGEFYLADLCHCRIYRGSKEIGRVIAVLEGTSYDFLEVESPDGRRFLVPFADHFVGEVDPQRQRIQVREGFEIP